MADLAFTGIQYASALKTESLQLGEACAEFDLVYRSGDKYFKSDCTDADKAKPTHILTQAGAQDAFVPAVQLGGDITLTGATLTQAAQYVLSANGGKIAPRTDLVSTNLLTNICLGLDGAATARFKVDATGIAIP